ncbi:MAG TPA: glycosyltransferase family 2 protein [Acidimicrobiia bacterium]|nr:glycosyltransferase family 2 protein [Acidimicrobiia bacterium]
MQSERITVVVPCYQETAVIPHLAQRLDELSTRLLPTYEPRYLFVDDGSQDQTFEMLQETFQGPNHQIIRHGHNRGVAAAILTGIRNSTTEVVCSIDADCTYDPIQLISLLVEFKPDVDLVTASPYHPAGEARNIPPWRLFLSRGLSRIYELTLHHRLATYTSCFRVYRRSAMVSLELKEEGFTGVAEMLALVDQRGGRIVEVPAILDVRKYGESKMKVFRTVRGHIRLISRLWALKLTGNTLDRREP